MILPQGDVPPWFLSRNLHRRHVLQAAEASVITQGGNSSSCVAAGMTYLAFEAASRSAVLVADPTHRLGIVRDTALDTGLLLLVEGGGREYAAQIARRLFTHHSRYIAGVVDAAALCVLQLSGGGNTVTIAETMLARWRVFNVLAQLVDAAEDASMKTEAASYVVEEEARVVVRVCGSPVPASEVATRDDAADAVLVTLQGLARVTQVLTAWHPWCSDSCISTATYCAWLATQRCLVAGRLVLLHHDFELALSGFLSSVSAIGVGSQGFSGVWLTLIWLALSRSPVQSELPDPATCRLRAFECLRSAQFGPAASGEEAMGAMQVCQWMMAAAPDGDALKDVRDKALAAVVGSIDRVADAHIYEVVGLLSDTDRLIGEAEIDGGVGVVGFEHSATLAAIDHHITNRVRSGAADIGAAVDVLCAFAYAGFTRADLWQAVKDRLFRSPSTRVPTTNPVGDLPFLPPLPGHSLVPVATGGELHLLEELNAAVASHLLFAFEKAAHPDALQVARALEAAGVGPAAQKTCEQQSDSPCGRTKRRSRSRPGR